MNVKKSNNSILKSNDGKTCKKLYFPYLYDNWADEDKNHNYNFDGKKYSKSKLSDRSSPLTKTDRHYNIETANEVVKKLIQNRIKLENKQKLL